MMTRAEVQAEYTVNENGIIQDPGKFESEPWYAVALWSLVLDSSSDETVDAEGQTYDVFIVDADLRAVLADDIDADTYAIVVDESDTGFVNTQEMSRAEYSVWQAEIENAEPTEPAEDDITTSDHETFYQNGRKVLSRANWLGADRSDEWYSHSRSSTVLLGTFGDDHKAALRAYMDKVQYWPNCWFISDHGNAHLMDLMEADKD